MFLTGVHTPAFVTGLAGVGRRHFLNRNAAQHGLVLNKLFQLVERPEVPVVPGIGPGGFPLFRFSNTFQVFQPDAAGMAYRQRNQIFADAMVDVRDDAALDQT